VTILDESHTLADAGLAADTDFSGVPLPGGVGVPIVARTDDDRIVRILWTDSGCENSDEVTATADRREFRLKGAATGDCGSPDVPRGVVLTFREAVPPEASARPDS
jgi:hypothetical protein